MTISSSEYPSVASLLARFDRESRGMRLRAQDAAELAAWQSELHARLRAIIGIDTMRACPLDPQIDAPEQCDGYVQTRVVIAVEPDVRMPLYVLNVTEQLDITRQAYALLGAEDRLAHTVFEGGHRWDGTDVLPWLARWLRSQ